MHFWSENKGFGRVTTASTEYRARRRRRFARSLFVTFGWQVGPLALMPLDKQASSRHETHSGMSFTLDANPQSLLNRRPTQPSSARVSPQGHTARFAGSTLLPAAAGLAQPNTGTVIGYTFHLSPSNEAINHWTPNGSRQVMQVILD